MNEKEEMMPNTDNQISQNTAEVKDVGNNESDKKSSVSLWGSIAEIIIFAWNSYVIFRNFSVHDGYFWAILGIIVNIGIVLSTPFTIQKVVSEKIPKLKKNQILGIIVAIFAGIFIIAGPVLGRVDTETLIEKSAVSLVDNIIHNQLGGDAKTKSVEIYKDLGDGSYKAWAHLDNGNDIKIEIEYYEKTDQIEVSIPWDQF